MTIYVVVITKTLTGYDALLCQVKQCHICFKNVIIEQTTLNDSCHTHA